MIRDKDSIQSTLYFKCPLDQSKFEMLEQPNRIYELKICDKLDIYSRPINYLEYQAVVPQESRLSEEEFLQLKDEERIKEIHDKGIFQFEGKRFNNRYEEYIAEAE